MELITADGKTVVPGRDAVWPTQFCGTRSIELFNGHWCAVWDDEDAEGLHITRSTPVIQCYSCEAAAIEAEAGVG